jgi:hypothetical protein
MNKQDIERMARAWQEVTENKFVIPEEIPANERTAFHGAAAAASKAGKTSFSFAGKKHPVTMKKDTANSIADQKEGYYKDMEIKKQDKEMGAKPVPAKKKKNGETATMNPKMDTAKSGSKGSEMEQKESRIRTALKSVLAEKAAHSPNKDKAEKPEDALHGDGAKQMKKDLEGPTVDIEKKSHDDAATAGRAGPSTKMRSNDNKQGDKKIVNPVAGVVTKEK